MTPSAAIVLAAGEGRRMGGPKALLVVDGRPLIHAHVQRLREARCNNIVVVTRHATAAAIGDMPGARVVCADTHSMAASLSIGLQDLAPCVDRVVLVAPVDTLPVRCSTLRALLTAAAAEGTLVATPQHRGRSGHPIALRERLLRGFREGYTGTLRDVVRGAGAQRCKLEVDDAAVLVDLDTPADLAAHRRGLAPCFYVTRLEITATCDR
jgi:CTP:molybdopterin cytidylyltransferase MocA